jgi:hypothetical protein
VVCGQTEARTQKVWNTSPEVLIKRNKKEKGKEHRWCKPLPGGLWADRSKNAESVEHFARSVNKPEKKGKGKRTQMV